MTLVVQGGVTRLDSVSISEIDILSMAEGENKPLKYPTICNSADVAVVTKSDLADAVEFDEPAARRNIPAVRPSVAIF